MQMGPGRPAQGSVANGLAAHELSARLEMPV